MNSVLGCLAAIALVASPAAHAGSLPATRKSAVARSSVRSSAPAATTPGRVLSPRSTRRFVGKVVERERNFYRPGVAYDGKTGMTFDGHPIDAKTGQLAGEPRNFSAASKESLHIILLVKALKGDPTARRLLSPDPKDPSRAVDVALDVLTRKIATYRRFDRQYPGYGGFLPWYKIEHGKVTPTDDWVDRVPGLDNGQLAWSLYLAANALDEAGHHELAAKYQAHLDLMKKNVVRVFYDPEQKKMRAEAKLENGNRQTPGRNHYANNQAHYFLDDPYEGLLLCHFADLFGDWKAHPDGKQAIFREPRRSPATFTAPGERLTVAEGNWFSSHEDWGFLILPYRDVKVADELFENAQKARTLYSAEHRFPGLFASTSAPVRKGAAPDGYLSALGVPSIAKEPVLGRHVFAPYAAFPLALADKRVFASWLKTMVDTPGMFGPYGMGESFDLRHRTSPLLTWDGKALPMIAWMGGVAPEIRGLLQRDGLYDTFLNRVRADYRKFDALPIEGGNVALAPPVR